MGHIPPGIENGYFSKKSILLALLSFACVLAGATEKPPAQFAGRTALIVGISLCLGPLCRIYLLDSILIFL